MATVQASSPGAVIPYPDVSEFGADDILLIDVAWAADVQKDIAEGRVGRPFKCFASSSANLERYCYTLRKRLGYEFGRTVTPRASALEVEQALFFERWEALVKAYGYLPAGGCTVPNPFAKEAPVNPFFPQFESLLRLMLSFGERVLGPFLDCSPFCDRDFTAKPMLWVSESVNVLQRLRDFVAQWERFKASHGIPGGGRMECLAAYSRRHINAWQQFQQGHAASKCFQLSAYLFGLAEVHFGMGQCSIALICTHRAVDLYFQSSAIGNNFIVQTALGLEYYNVKCREKVSVMNSLGVLEDEGVLIADAKRRDTLWRLNGERNRLALTHAVYGVKRDVVRDFMRDVEGLIAQIEGSNRWSLARSAWFPLPTLEPIVIFDLEPSLASYMNEVKFD